MINVNLQSLVNKASDMALHNIWDEKAYKINMVILKRDHNNCAACTRLAKYYKLNNNIPEAKNMYLKVLEIDPENHGAINNLEDIEMDQKETDEVDKVKTLAELLKEGLSSMLKGRYKLASKLYTRAYSIEPTLAHASSLAGAYKKMGQFDSIEDLYNQHIEVNHKKSDVKVITEEFKKFRTNTKDLAE